MKIRKWMPRFGSRAQGALLGALLPLALGLALPAGYAQQAYAATSAQQRFDTPEAGVGAMVAAVRAGDQVRLRAILGPGSSKLVRSGDEVEDRQGRDAFLKSYDEASKLAYPATDKVLLLVGKDEWPMPIPLVRDGAQWRFDARQGEAEILARRIGRNELAAIQVCQAIVAAEREYTLQDPNHSAVPEYAARLASTPGKRDGLYWPTQAGEPESPLGPLLAAAARDGYGAALGQSQAPTPYHGYYYRILARQGKEAAGGAYDYIVRGRMIGGFALVAYPARYGASGVMTFLVSQDGQVLQKDLGRRTAVLAGQMSAYNPDASWTKP